MAVLVALLCIVLQATGLPELLRFDRQAIADGSWWLLLTGNFVHLGASHLWMNMAGFALIVALIWVHYSLFQWACIILFSSLVVGIGLYLRDPEVLWYVGYSGTLHGLIMAGCIADLRKYPKSAAILLVLIVGKLAWEQLAGALPGSESVAGGRVVVNSHLYGAIGGTLIGLVLTGFSLRKNTFFKTADQQEQAELAQSQPTHRRHRQIQQMQDEQAQNTQMQSDQSQSERVQSERVPGTQSPRPEQHNK